MAILESEHGPALGVALDVAQVADVTLFVVASPVGLVERVEVARHRGALFGEVAKLVDVDRVGAAFLQSLQLAVDDHPVGLLGELDDPFDLFVEHSHAVHFVG